MYQKLVSHNDDLKRLVEKGYAVGFDSNHLVIRDIPYLDNQLQLQWGAIVSKLIFVNSEKVTQDDHQIYFAGTHPHNIDGNSIPNLGGTPYRIPLSEMSADVVVQRSFSNKPRSTGSFSDLYEKIESYVGIISGPAMELYGVTPYTFRMVGSDHDSVFKIADTMTSRAEITDLSSKFKNDVIAIIGLGGTGAYILDFLVKTPVKEIRAYDHDRFFVHNAFRSPGKLDLSELDKPKTDVYHSRYDGFRHGLSFETKIIDSSCSTDLEEVTFAFVCVDKGPSRAAIFDLLISKNIPFIDVGLGLNRKHESLQGLVRTTYYSVENNKMVRELKLAEENESPDDIYHASIQIGELNALNACLAVIKFKQLRGFYYEKPPTYHLLFEIGDLKIASE